MPDLSIVFGTYNRLDCLKQCLASLKRAANGLAYEAVITDGGSTDGTLDYLRGCEKVHLIEHGALYGPVKAYNDAFAAATGEYVAYINDDLILMPGALSAAVKLLSNTDVGVVSLPYTSEHNPGEMVLTVTTRPNGGRGYPMASFGVLRRAQGEQVGWFGPWFYHYHGDSNLCLSIQELGLEVRPLDFAAAHHLRRNNAVRGFAWWIEGAKERSRHDGTILMLLWGGWELGKPVQDGIDPELASTLKAVYQREPKVIGVDELDTVQNGDVVLIPKTAGNGHIDALLPNHDVLPRHGWNLLAAVPKEPKPVG
jgi:glycosyltransferase involved in cell wall biosynthesis